MTNDSLKHAVSVFKSIFPNLTKAEGCILWGIISNHDVRDKDGRKISGSFRWNGDMISQVVGEGDYLDYYMSDSFTKGLLNAVSDGYGDEIERRLREELEQAGITIVPL